MSKIDKFTGGWGGGLVSPLKKIIRNVFYILMYEKKFLDLNFTGIISVRKNVFYPCFYRYLFGEIFLNLFFGNIRKILFTPTSPPPTFLGNK